MTTVPIPTRRRASSAPCFSSRKTSCWADLFKETNAEETNKTPTTVITRPSHPSAVLIAQHYDCNANDRMTTPAATTTDEVTAQPTEQQTEPVNTTTETVTEIETETVPKPLAPLPTRLPPSETVQLHMATITQEELRILPTTVPRGRCCVCFSPDTSLVFVCGNEITPAAMASTATTTTTCEGALCLDCAKAYIENIMCDSKYSLPTVRCPGRCFGSIPSASWRGALHYGDDLSSSSAEAEEDVRHKEKEAKLNCTPTVVPCCRSWKDVLLGVNKDEEEKAKEQEARRRMEVESKKQKLKEKVKRRKENIEFESSMVRRFESNFSTVLSIRCGACDNTCDMSECDLVDDAASREALVAEVLSMGGGQGGQELQELVFSQWVGFMQHKVSAAELVETMSQYIDMHNDEAPNNDEGDVLTDDRVRFFYEVVAPLMRDVERRARFLLTVYKKFPKFYVQCCHYEHCFACKIDNWHEGITCEQHQRDELDIEAQFCPECGVPTIRTDGCSDMLCACGGVWQWEGDDCDY
mmetsp:Transcript_20716/g.38466  ORF Transcript_20716/g.38466 Transcript_20716/m.38466 type:complete len:526 (+) Transcript_20716:83-1660(+)